MTIQALQDELRTQRDLNHLLQQEGGNRSDHFSSIELTEENFRRLQAEHDRQAKELFLLRKTLEEMELRIETQKQTLGARDESIKKLLEMLQSKGLPPGPGRVSEDEEQERARRIAEAEAQLGHLEVILDQKDKENIHLREVLYDQVQFILIYGGNCIRLNTNCFHFSSLEGSVDLICFILRLILYHIGYVT